VVEDNRRDRTFQRRAGGVRVTLIWLVVWFIADRIGDREHVIFNPVNWWAGTLLLGVALDLNRPRIKGQRH